MANRAFEFKWNNEAGGNFRPGACEHVCRFGTQVSRRSRGHSHLGPTIPHKPRGRTSSSSDPFSRSTVDIHCISYIRGHWQRPDRQWLSASTPAVSAAAWTVCGSTNSPQPSKGRHPTQGYALPRPMQTGLASEQVISLVAIGLILRLSAIAKWGMALGDAGVIKT
eukprot:2361432-Pleurochrysis_carterae.AAC.5